MTRVSVNPGRVEWSGENSGILLENSLDADYATLALFFRIVLSPHGRGDAALVLGAPDADVGWPYAPNFLMTNNQRMMRWIVDGWVRKFSAFRNRPGIESMKWLDLHSICCQPAHLRSRHREKAFGSDIELEMVWSDLGEPVPVEADRSHSPTGEHDMYSVFVEAASASVIVNGTPLPGQVGCRRIFDRTMSTAFLALSNTWVTPSGTGD